MESRQSQAEKSRTSNGFSVKNLFLLLLLATARTAAMATSPQETQPIILHKGNRLLGDDLTMSDCIRAAPDCVLKLTSLIPLEHKQFRAEQICDPLPEDSLPDQLRSGDFLGETFCEGSLYSSQAQKDGSVSTSRVDFDVSPGAYKLTQGFFVPKKPVEAKTASCPEPVKCAEPEEKQCPELKTIPCPPPKPCFSRLYMGNNVIAAGHETTHAVQLGQGTTGKHVYCTSGYIR